MCYGGITVVQFIVLKSCRDLLVNNLFSSRISLPFLKKNVLFSLAFCGQKNCKYLPFRIFSIEKRGIYNVNENHT